MIAMNDFFRNLGGDLDNLQRMFDCLPIGVMAVDRDDLIVYYNKAQGRLENLTPEEALGRKERDVYGVPDFSPGIMRTCRRMNRPILGFMCTYYTRKDPARIIEGAFWAFPLHDGAGGVTGSLCFTINVGSMEVGRLKSVVWPEYLPITQPSSEIIGSNQAVAKALHLAKSKADSPSPVLITGETGVGKELVARLVHSHSSRSAMPFMPINCAAIPAQLLEGLIFGTTRGSFTGAVDRPGLFEEANGGTVYLDEIDSMPMELQPKMLRLLQGMRVTRLGSAKEIGLDVKIVSSIACSATEALLLNRMRPDLFYRLAVIVLHIPPLRERLDDLDELLSFFVAKYNQQLRQKVVGFDDQVMAWFKGYSWPGNIRELENLVAGSINMAGESEVLTVDHLPYHYVFIKDQEEQSAAPARPPAPPAAAGATAIELDEIRIIKEQLVQTRGHLGKAAERLGISRQLLSYKMRKYGLNRHDFRPRLAAAS
jgi:arginine utilization regulatory protein